MQQKVFSDWFLALPLVINIFAQVHKCETVECTHSSVTDMLSNLGWRSLELRRYDSRIAMFYKIVYGLVAMPVSHILNVPWYKHAIILLLTGRSILLTVILWKRLPADLVLDSDLDSFKQGVSKINHTLP